MRPHWAVTASAWLGAAVASAWVLGAVVLIVSFGPYALLAVFLCLPTGASAGLGLVFLISFIKKGGTPMLVAGLVLAAVASAFGVAFLANP